MIECCKDCEKRYVGCHSTCEDYIAEKKADAERKAKMETERKLNSSQIQKVIARKDAMIKRQKKHRGYSRLGR